MLGCMLDAGGFKWMFMSRLVYEWCEGKPNRKPRYEMTSGASRSILLEWSKGMRCAKNRTLNACLFFRPTIRLGLWCHVTWNVKRGKDEPKFSYSTFLLKMVHVLNRLIQYLRGTSSTTSSRRQNNIWSSIIQI